ncbi:MAG: bifunctional [glutamate--ammonia ligase]-adenylyl-L-tyrosine phosphorylase/[glutamate--ammonia-ligase] adenylyltransferase [Mariprofundaceae bacterium]|nr:bifunctional [glutamate--ammonia ligase]-adenylyl-L-tyrosine phosphorylase/[glutamate--ammonia-ligase] adenylyltransferase [Mariprofundaceae bacterium]
MSDTAIRKAIDSAPEFGDSIHHLAEMSPLFVDLMRRATEAEMRELLRAEGEAKLPDANPPWVPDNSFDNPNSAMLALRECKRRGMRHFLWWELGLHADIEQSAKQLAIWAGALLQSSYEISVELLAPRYGRIEHGRFTIIGLGKLGGMELNLGSDVDILFVWDSVCRETTGGRRTVSAQEYYQNLSRMIIKLMAEQSIGGIVWPVDMRLRPGGDGSAICLNLDATLEHYCHYGQTWERAMLIKAAPVAGVLVLGQEFLEGVRPFIYRRYLDYTTVQALAKMKQRIDAQGSLHEIGAGFDVKRGRGGIREIEFFIQSLQLLHGGRNPELRSQPSMQSLNRLCEHGIIHSEDRDALHQAYCFWRRIEHAIQSRRGEQTHKLPADFETYLNSALGSHDVSNEMRLHAEKVHALFAAQFAEVELEESSGIAWMEMGREELSRQLGSFDDEQVNRAQVALQRIDSQLHRGILPERSRQQVEKILACCMEAWRVDANGVQAVEQLASLFQNIAGRATWVDLLATHESVLQWLISMLSASHYIAEHLVKNPSWLEWPVEDERGAGRIRTINQQLGKLDPTLLDEEEFLSDLGRLIDQARLTCAVEIASDDDADPMLIGRWLSDSADEATRAALRLALHQFELPDDFPIIAVAMGKHGSRTMGLVSDLDMVFLFICDDPSGMGPKGRSMRDWAQRIGRRMIQHLTLQPPFGAGFEFDSRLRPSGAKGALVTTLHNFEAYQLHEAQTWEHQALTRARAVAGPDEFRKHAGIVVESILNQKRDRKALAAEVISMREKMVEHLSSKESEQINIKQDPGGLVDIEFLAQYARLAFGGDEKETAGILGQLPDSAPAVWKDAAEMLDKTFVDYRRMENALRVHLWASVGRLPADDTASEWETLRRHAPIKSVAELKQRMVEIRKLFITLLNKVE